MKNLTRNSVLFFLLFAPIVVFTQEEQSKLDAISIAKEFEISNYEKKSSSDFGNANNQLESYILVSQVGNFNSSNIAGYFNSGHINVMQNGNNNSSDIYRAGNEVKENLFQSGDNNQFIDYSPFSYVNEVNVNINQFGDNLTIYNYGSNSITENLNFTQTGSNQTIIIFNN